MVVYTVIRKSYTHNFIELENPYPIPIVQLPILQFSSSVTNCWFPSSSLSAILDFSVPHCYQFLISQLLSYLFSTPRFCSIWNLNKKEIESKLCINKSTLAIVFYLTLSFIVDENEATWERERLPSLSFMESIAQYFISSKFIIITKNGN